MSQLHKRFLSIELKKLFDRYLQNEVERKYMKILGPRKVGSRAPEALQTESSGFHDSIPKNDLSTSHLSRRSNRISSKNWPSERKSSRTKRSCNILQLQLPSEPSKLAGFLMFTH